MPKGSRMMKRETKAPDFPDPPKGMRGRGYERSDLTRELFVAWGPKVA